MKALHALIMTASLLGMVVLAIAAIGECVSHTNAAIIFITLFVSGMYASGEIVD